MGRHTLESHARRMELYRRANGGDEVRDWIVAGVVVGLASALLIGGYAIAIIVGG